MFGLDFLKNKCDIINWNIMLCIFVNELNLFQIYVTKYVFALLKNVKK